MPSSSSSTRGVLLKGVFALCGVLILLIGFSSTGSSGSGSIIIRETETGGGQQQQFHQKHVLPAVALNSASVVAKTLSPQDQQQQPVENSGGIPSPPTPRGGGHFNPQQAALEAVLWHRDVRKGIVASVPEKTSPVVAARKEEDQLAKPREQLLPSPPPPVSSSSSSVAAIRPPVPALSHASSPQSPLAPPQQEGNDVAGGVEAGGGEKSIFADPEPENSGGGGGAKQANPGAVEGKIATVPSPAGDTSTAGSGGGGAVEETMPPTSWKQDPIWNDYTKKDVRFLQDVVFHEKLGVPKGRPGSGDSEADGKLRGSNMPRGEKWEEPATPPLPNNIATTQETRAFFSDILMILMLSPPRYKFARQTYEHYARYCPHILVAGPKKNETDEITLQGLKVRLFDIVYGNEQYRATSAIIKEIEEQGDDELKKKYNGYLYIADDLLLHPWALAAQGRKNKTMVWAGPMGVANTVSNKNLVTAIPAMSIEPQFRSMPWPYWRKNRIKLHHALMEGGPRMRDVLRLAGLSTYPWVLQKSKYNMNLYNYRDLEWSIFFTIVDTYYVPKHLALAVAYYFDLMAKHWVFGECAIATALRAVAPTYLEMQLQFYWSIGTAKGCPRHKWHTGIDGFHRCHHGHPFAELMYNETARDKLKDDDRFRKEGFALKFEDPVPRLAGGGGANHDGGGKEIAVNAGSGAENQE